MYVHTLLCYWDDRVGWWYNEEEKLRKREEKRRRRERRHTDTHSPKEKNWMSGWDLGHLDKDGFTWAPLEIDSRGGRASQIGMEKQWVGSGSEGLVCLRVDKWIGIYRRGEQEKRGMRRGQEWRMRNEEESEKSSLVKSGGEEQSSPCIICLCGFSASALYNSTQ